MANSPIDHIIVLVLENRSFDHIFGVRPGVVGLNGTETNPEARPLQGIPAPPVGIFSPRDDSAFVTFPDPPHEFANVSTQLFVGPTNNNGFVIAYAESRGPNGLANGPEIGRHAMQYFSRDQLPVINRLADEFVVCDHWFASVPGPTWPNRLFIHAATSGGLADSPSDFMSGANAVFGLYDLRTIYQNIDEHKGPGGERLTWGIYKHDLPQSASLRYVNALWTSNVRSFDFFERDLRGQEFPNYAVIEPHAGLLSADLANDMHPAHDVRKGEALISSIYDKLRASPIWESSLFVVLFDEHGGFFDHVTPPSNAVPPDPHVSTDPAFGFDRLGVRVPCLLISPWLEGGKVVDTVFDHSSLVASVKNIFGLTSFLTARDAAAATFDGLLGNLRKDALPPGELKPQAAPQSPVALDLNLTQNQRALLSIGLGPDSPRDLRVEAEHVVSARRTAYKKAAATWPVASIQGAVPVMPLTEASRVVGQPQLPISLSTLDALERIVALQRNGKNLLSAATKRSLRATADAIVKQQAPGQPAAGPRRRNPCSSMPKR